MYCLYLAATYQVRQFLCYGRNGGWGVDIGKQILISAMSSVFFCPTIMLFDPQYYTWQAGQVVIPILGMMKLVFLEITLLEHLTQCMLHLVLSHQGSRWHNWEKRGGLLSLDYREASNSENNSILKWRTKFCEMDRNFVDGVENIFFIRVSRLFPG